MRVEARQSAFSGSCDVRADHATELSRLTIAPRSRTHGPDGDARRAPEGARGETDCDGRRRRRLYSSARPVNKRFAERDRSGEEAVECGAFLSTVGT